MYKISQTSQGFREQSQGNISQNRAQTKLANRTHTSQNTVNIPITEIIEIQQKIQGNEDNFRQYDKMQLQGQQYIIKNMNIISYQKSQERIKKWPNTINALRKKKDQTRFERFRQDEEERRRIEIEEAQYQAQIKKEVLGKANQQLYENNDRIRAFQSKILMSDVQQEIQGQIEINKLKKEIEMQREQIFLEQQRENIKNEEQLEQEKLNELKGKRDQAKQQLSQQYLEMKQKAIRRIQTDRIEGELVKQHVQEKLDRELADEKERKQRTMQNQAEIRQGNLILQQIKNEKYQKEKEEEEKIIDYAKKKDQIMQMRKQREKLIFKEKQEKIQKLIDTQEENLRNIEKNRELILDKQFKDNQIKIQREEQLKQQKLDELKNRVILSRKINEIEKVKKQEVEKQNEAEFQEFWKKRNCDLIEQEKNEIEDIRKRNNQLKQYHLKQADDKMKIREQLIHEDIEQQEIILQKRENEDKTFGSWAERCVKEWDQNGKNIGPLIKELIQFKQQ